jgi:hypothetical protein
MVDSIANKIGLPLAPVRLWLSNRILVERNLNKRALKRLKKAKEGSEAYKIGRDHFAPWVTDVLKMLFKECLYIRGILLAIESTILGVNLI